MQDKCELSRKLGIVIVNFNAGDFLIKCLKSILEVSQKNFSLKQVVIVDNASSDNSLLPLENIELPLCIIKNKKNLGFSKACNQGAGVILNEVDYLLFLNPDTILSENVLDRMIDVMRNNSLIGVCGPQIIDFNSKLIHTCDQVPKSIFDFFPMLFGMKNFLRFGLKNTDFDHVHSSVVDHVMGSCYMIRKDLFSQLNGFDERYFVYYEDIDLSRRVKESGYVIYFLSTAYVHHYAGGCSEKVKANRLAFNLNSKCLYIKKYFKQKELYLFVILSCLIEFPLRILRELLKFNFKGVKEVLMGYKLFFLTFT